MVSTDGFFARDIPDESRAAVHLKGMCNRKGVTQVQFAKMSGISLWHISQMENGKRSIGKKSALKLAAALNADVRAFLWAKV